MLVERKFYSATNAFVSRRLFRVGVIDVIDKNSFFDVSQLVRTAFHISRDVNPYLLISKIAGSIVNANHQTFTNWIRMSLLEQIKRGRSIS
ncbi:hypothetical protein D3C71_1844760 [compost metagenome]